MQSSNTIPEDSPEISQQRSLAFRRLGITLLAIFVAASAFLEVRYQTVTNSSGTLQVSITYPTVGRRGLATPLEFRILQDGGPVVLWINASYLGLVDHNSWIPEPIEIRARGSEVGLVYEPEGGSLEVKLDTRFAPSTPPGRHELRITIEAQAESIDFQLSTWVVP